MQQQGVWAARPSRGRMRGHLVPIWKCNYPSAMTRADRDIVREIKYNTKLCSGVGYVVSFIQFCQYSLKSFFQCTLLKSMTFDRCAGICGGNFFLFRHASSHGKTWTTRRSIQWMKIRGNNITRSCCNNIQALRSKKSIRRNRKRFFIRMLKELSRYLHHTILIPQWLIVFCFIQYLIIIALIDDQTKRAWYNTYLLSHLKVYLIVQIKIILNRADRD